MGLVLIPLLLVLVFDLDRYITYQRHMVSNGSWWLLITSHFAHMNSAHWMLNASAWVLIWLYAQSAVPLSQWIISVPSIALGTGLGLFFLSPEVAWYTGLSGVLHGLMLVVLYRMMMRNPADVTVYIVLLALITKVTVEQLHGPTPGTAELAGGPVITVAHFYGLLSGVAVSACLFILDYARNR